LKPTSGQALIAGYDVVKYPQQVRENIGFMSNATAIYDRLTAWEIVEFFGRLNGMRKNDLKSRMEEIFDWLQMNSFREVLGAKLSTGMKQKVSIARTIVHNPPVLIFDEPTSGLDVLVARVLLEKIKELKNLGKTIILSTHSMHEVVRLCQRVAIIHRGELQAMGPIDELLTAYNQPDLEELFFYLVDRADARAEEMGAVQP
jgi:sodium transport system ATP-binding protein